MRLARVGERQDDAHPGSQIAAVDHAGEFSQVLGCDLDQEEGRIDPAALRKLLIGFGHGRNQLAAGAQNLERTALRFAADEIKDRKSTRLNSSHANISYAVFCLKKTKK